MLAVFISMLLFFGTTGAIEFPSKLERCHKSDPKLNHCLERALENAMHVLGQTAIPSANLPLVDPLAVSKLTIGAGSRAVHLVQNYHNVKLIGLSKPKVDNLSMDWEKKTLSFRAFFKELKQVGKYDIDGKVLILPMVGHGDATLILLDVYVDSVLHFKEATKDGKKFFEVLSYDLKLTPKDCKLEFLNLFDGDERLAGPVSKVIEENSLDLFNDVKGGVEDAYAEVCRQLSKAIFDTFPIDDVFLP